MFPIIILAPVPQNGTFRVIREEDDMLEIRECRPEDLSGLLQLYTQLHGDPAPAINDRILDIWERIMNDENHHILGGFQDGALVTSCVINIILNLTHNQRPYAVIENVITDASERGRGHASAVLKAAKEIAEKEKCYKIMLMTGSKKDSTLHFYEAAGYNRLDKTAFVQWL